MFKTAWQVLISPFAALAWIIMALILLVGWGPQQVRDFAKAWDSMFEEEPVTGGPLPPDPVERKKGEGIG